ncbi:MAG: peptidylprolyl isomerase [Cytophagales bacterium]|nr:peptidylprolyl isomerase [Cytophagales bacterium]MDW8384633.1 peptidylprolyl isomerase [Flammeovirgaceae bacterium]
MKNYYAFLLVALLGCSPQQTRKIASNSSTPIILTIGDRNIFLKDFEYLYKKNYAHSDSAYTESSLRNYLDLYTKFQLKVTEALAQKLDSTAEFQNEFNSYRKQLAAPYLTDKNVTQEIVRQAYERLKEEIRASHILIRCGLTDRPEDTLKAYRKIQEIRQRALKEDFGQLAYELSEDPSARENRGDLGYFTALQMVYEFENAAYNTPQGEISLPFRTQFGYHLVKVTDRRPSRGTVRVAHIMIRTYPGMAEDEQRTAYDKIMEIYQRVTSGEDWNTLCAQFSEDGATAATGGELPPFTAAGMIESFANAAFALNTPEEISSPVQTPFGWHIIKLIEKNPLEPFEKLEPQLRQRISRDSRAQVTQRKFLDRIKKENAFSENSKVQANAIAYLDTSQSLLKGEWKAPSHTDLLQKVLFTIGNQSYSVQNFYDFVLAQQGPQPENVSASAYAQTLYHQFVDQSLLQYEEANLEKKYSEFAQLVQEYRDGILLFKIMEDNVWNKAVQDTVGLRNFYLQNKSNYMWKERAQAIIFDVASLELLDSLKKELKRGEYPVLKIPAKEIFYSVGQTFLPQESKSWLADFAKQLTRNLNYKLYIYTYLGEKNEKPSLTEQRLQAVRKYLDSLNVYPSQIIVQDKGVSPFKYDPKKKNGGHFQFALFSSSYKTLEANFNLQNPLNLKILQGKFEQKDHKIFEKIAFEKGRYETDLDGRFYYIIIDEILPPQPKAIEEARGAVVSDYQNYLEEKWIEELKKRYKVIVHEDALRTLIKK